MTLADGLTIIVSALALAFSIYNYIEARRSKKPQINVSFTSGVLIDRNSPQEDNVEYLGIDVRNPGQTKVNIRSITLRSKFGNAFPVQFIDNYEVPFLLSPGESKNLMIPKIALTNTLYRQYKAKQLRVRILARDALDNQYYSNALTLKYKKGVETP